MTGIVRMLFVLTVIISVVLGVRIADLENERRSLSEDAIELSKVKYGIFNIDEWKRVVADVVTKKIEEIDLSDQNRNVLKQRISSFLTKVIRDLKGRFRSENKGFMGGIKNVFSDFLGVFDQMERDVPVFTDQIIAFLDDPRNRKDLRNYILEKVNTYADETFSETDYTLHDAVLAKYGFEDRASAIAGLEARAEEKRDQIKPYAYALYFIILVLVVFLLATAKPDKTVLAAIIALSFVPLVLGVFLPMIEIDARIAEMRFQLLGEPVSFTDQVLYFKSKSILEVVQLMVVQGKADLVGVAILVLAFSVLFPLAKLISSLLYLFFAPLRSHRFIKFMVFKTGKWSMADVMVIAIFMSYIGFSGIISEQLSQLESITRNMDVLTTNRSSLQTGFFMFTSFVLLSLMISQRIKSAISSQEDSVSFRIE